VHCGRPRPTMHCAPRTQSAVCKAVPWLRPAVAGLLPTFGPGPVLVNCVLDKVALSLSFHHCFVFSSIYILLPPEGQIGEAWEPSKKQCPSGNRRASDSKVCCVLSVLCAVCYQFCVLSVRCAVCYQFCVLSVRCAVCYQFCVLCAISAVCCVLSVLLNV
jgi:hypothetical protein